MWLRGQPQPSGSSRFPVANRAARHGPPLAGAAQGRRALRSGNGRPQRARGPAGGSKPLRESGGGRAARSRGGGSWVGPTVRPLTALGRASRPPGSPSAPPRSGRRARRAPGGGGPARSHRLPPQPRLGPPADGGAERASRGRVPAGPGCRYAGVSCPAASLLRLSFTSGRVRGYAYSLFLLNQALRSAVLRMSTVCEPARSSGAELGLRLARGSRAARAAVPSRPGSALRSHTNTCRNSGRRCLVSPYCLPHSPPQVPSASRFRPGKHFDAERGASRFLCICTYKSLFLSGVSKQRDSCDRHLRALCLTAASSLLGVILSCPAGTNEPELLAVIARSWPLHTAREEGGLQEFALATWMPVSHTSSLARTKIVHLQRTWFSFLDSTITDGLLDCLLLLPTNFLLVNSCIIYETEKLQRSNLADYCLPMNHCQRNFLYKYAYESKDRFCCCFLVLFSQLLFHNIPQPCLNVWPCWAALSSGISSTQTRANRGIKQWVKVRGR